MARTYKNTKKIEEKDFKSEIFSKVIATILFMIILNHKKIPHLQKIYRAWKAKIKSGFILFCYL